MIGSLLRNGDIDSNALSEIEGTLGIRIVNRGRDPQEFNGGQGQGNTELLPLLGLYARQLKAHLGRCHVFTSALRPTQATPQWAATEGRMK